MTVWLDHGDMREVLRRLIDEQVQVDAIVTDPPYHLTTGKKGGTGPASLNLNSPAGRARISTGFMGKVWDGGNIAFDPETWRFCHDVLPPGGHMLAFGGTRGFHRMMVAIEDAGFELRDTLMWVYGQGFPKSKNQHGAWEGFGTSLKPSWEPIVLARKPLDGTVAANLLKHGVGAINIDGCKIGFASKADETEAKTKNQHTQFGSGPMTNQVYGKYTKDRDDYNPAGRWPANLIHDGSDEVVGLFPNSRGGHYPTARGVGGIGNNGHKGQDGLERFDIEAGSAARFFYAAKASSAERRGSKHPTIKPLALMRWLVRLITPPNGVVLDPFAGSGTTGEAAKLEGFDCILVEREAEYAADIKVRIPDLQIEVLA